MNYISIECLDGNLSYMPTKVILVYSVLFEDDDVQSVKLNYPVHIVARIVRAFTHNFPILCDEFTSFHDYFQYVNCIHSMNLYECGLKWVDDLFQLQDWISNYKVSANSMFTVNTNFTRSPTTVTLVFPYAAHNAKESPNGQALEEHCYRFAWKMIQSSLPGTKNGPLDNKKMEFVFYKDDYPTKDAVDEIVRQFVSILYEQITLNYHSNSRIKSKNDSQNESQNESQNSTIPASCILWNINKVEKIVCLPLNNVDRDKDLLKKINILDDRNPCDDRNYCDDQSQLDNSQFKINHNIILDRKKIKI